MTEPSNCGRVQCVCYFFVSCVLNPAVRSITHALRHVLPPLRDRWWNTHALFLQSCCSFCPKTDPFTTQAAKNKTVCVCVWKLIIKSVCVTLCVLSSYCQACRDMKGKFVFCFGVCVSPRFSPQFPPLGCLVWPVSDRRTNTSLHIDSPITFGSEPRWLSAFSFSVLIIFILKNHFIMQGYLTVKSLYNLLSVYANGEQKLLRLHRKEKNARTEIYAFLWWFFSPLVANWSQSEQAKIKSTLCGEN